MAITILNHEEGQVALNGVDAATASQYMASAVIAAAANTASAVGTVVVASQAQLAAQALTLQSLALMSMIIENSGAEKPKASIASAPPTVTAPWPVDPNQAGGCPDPTTWQDAANKIREYLAILAKDGEQFTTLSNMTQFLVKCYEKFGPNSVERRQFDAAINGMAIAQGYTSIGSLIVDSLTGAEFYSADGDFKGKTKAFLDDLIKRLRDAQVTTGIGSDILNKAIMRRSNIDSWMAARIKPDGTRDQSYAQFLRVQGGINDYFFGTSNINQWRNLYMHNLIEEFMRTHKNPEEVLVFLLAIVSGYISDESGFQMGAYGNAVKKLTDGTSTMAKIMNIFKSGNFNADTAKQLFQAMADQKAITDADKRKQGGIAPQVDSAFDAFFNCSYNGTTLGQLFKDGNFTALAAGLNSLGPDATKPDKDLTKWKGLIDGLDGASKAFTNESSATGVKLNQATNDDNTLTATRQSMLKSITDLCKFMIEASKR